jgi:lysophospholipase L1-like esterase
MTEHFSHSLPPAASVPAENLPWDTMKLRTISTYALCITLGILASSPLRRLRDHLAPPRPPAPYTWDYRHQAFVARSSLGQARIVFLGDSIADGWSDQPIWDTWFVPRGAVDYGIPADSIEKIHRRALDGELTGIRPRAIVVVAGTNNLAADLPPTLAGKLASLLRDLRRHQPQARLILTSLLPRQDGLNERVQSVNALLPAVAARHQAIYLNLWPHFAGADGQPRPGLLADINHPSPEGYRVWSDQLCPLLTTPDR